MIEAPSVAAWSKGDTAYWLVGSDGRPEASTISSGIVESVHPISGDYGNLLLADGTQLTTNMAVRTERAALERQVAQCRKAATILRRQADSLDVFATGLALRALDPPDASLDRAAAIAGAHQMAAEHGYAFAVRWPNGYWTVERRKPSLRDSRFVVVECEGDRESLA